MQAEHVLIGHIVRHFAQAVHIIGKGDELGRNLVVGEQPESLTHHGCARHFAECADMRQARGAIAGFKQNFSFMRLLGAAGQQFAGLFKGPGIGHLCGFNQCSGKMISHCGIRFQMGQKELLLYRQLTPGAQEELCRSFQACVMMLSWPHQLSSAICHERLSFIGGYGLISNKGAEDAEL